MMNMNRDKVVKIAEDHKLSITIRPDGSIIGFDYDLAMLRLLYAEATKQNDDASKKP